MGIYIALFLSLSLSSLSLSRSVSLSLSPLSSLSLSDRLVSNEIIRSWGSIPCLLNLREAPRLLNTHCISLGQAWCHPRHHCPSLTLVRKSLHAHRSMLAGQQITPLIMKINAFLSEFEPKYLWTSIALWVDGGSQEAQYG